MNTIFEVDQLTSPLFSIALSRSAVTTDAFGGVLAMGGIPSLTDPVVNVTGSLVSTPMTGFNVSYTIAIDNAQYGSATGADAGGIYLVDSGTTLIYAPAALAESFANEYNPPATVQDGIYITQCTATPPTLSFTIAGEVFTVNPVDLLSGDVGNASASCATGVQPAGPGGNTLGGVFLTNVLAVFDWGSESIRYVQMCSCLYELSATFLALLGILSLTLLLSFSFGAREYYSTT